MDDGVGAGQGKPQAGRVVDVSGPQVNAVAGSRRQAIEHQAAGRARADQGEHPVAARDQLGNHVAADEAAGAGDQDGGHDLSVASPGDPIE